MYIIIVGAGAIGLHLARHLSSEGHNIIVIDSNPERIEEIDESSALDVMTKLGNGGAPDMLIEAGVEKADMLLAVTNSDETNIIASMIASTLGVERRIARVRSHEYFRRNSILQPIDLGIDLLINPEQEAATEIIQLLERPYASERRIICKGKLERVGVIVDEVSPIANKNLIEVGEIIQEEFRISMIIRKDVPIIPTGSTVVLPNDTIFFMVLACNVENVAQKLNLSSGKISNIFIVGGGNIGLTVARYFESKKGVRIKLIENKKEKALKLSEMLSKTLVLEADGTNADFLLSEGLKDSDAFISVTGNEEANILSCLVAHKKGIKTNIALVQRPDYLPLISKMGINVISPRSITVDKILRFVRGNKVLSMSTLVENMAEVIEFKVDKKSSIIGKPLKNINIPKDTLLGAIIRNHEPIIPTGNTIVEPGDGVFVFALKSAVVDIAKLF